MTEIAAQISKNGETKAISVRVTDVNLVISIALSITIENLIENFNGFQVHAICYIYICIYVY